MVWYKGLRLKALRLFSVTRLLAIKGTDSMRLMSCKYTASKSVCDYRPAYVHGAIHYQSPA